MWLNHELGSMGRCETTRNPDWLIKNDKKTTDWTDCDQFILDVVKLWCYLHKYLC